MALVVEADTVVVVGTEKVGGTETAEEDTATVEGTQEEDTRAADKTEADTTEVGTMAMGMVEAGTKDTGTSAEGNIRWPGPGSTRWTVVVREAAILEEARLVVRLQLRFATVESVDACILQTRFYIYYRRPQVLMFLKRYNDKIIHGA